MARKRPDAAPGTTFRSLTAQMGQTAAPAGGAWDEARGRPRASREDAPPRHSRELLSRVNARIAQDNLSIIAAGVGFYALLGVLDLASDIEGVVSLVRWPLLALAMVLGLGVLYRYGPSRETARGGWFRWGAVVATLLWLAGAALFSFYVSNFGKYNETYGSVGAIVVLLLWFLLTAYVILVGAEIDAVLERSPRAVRDAPKR